MRIDRSLLARDTVPSLLVSMGLGEQPNGQYPAWIGRALAAVATMWPIVMLTRLSIMAALSVPIERHWPANGGATVLLLVIALLLFDFAIVLLPRLDPMRRLPPHVQLRWFASLIFLSSLFYALALRTVSFPLSTGLTSLSVIMPALVAVGIFGAQRVLGFLHCLASTLPFLGDLDGAALAIPLASLIGLLLATIAQARADQLHFQQRTLHALRGEQARALLTDFEESGQGWFWETDRAGNLTYVSQTLARKTGRTVEDLIGSRLTDLIDRTAAGRQGDGERTVGFHLSARTGFSDIVVSAANLESECWWSISGRPVLNELGQFLGFRGSGADLTEMRRSQAEIARLARFDSLTGLANRGQVMALLEQSVVDPTGRQTNCGLFILDLDRFKSVNDTMGHPAGDALLRKVAQRLSRVVGDHGQVGRPGGDEFQIVLPGMTDRQDLAKLAEGIIHSVSQPYVIDDAQVVIGVSVGIAISPYDGVDPQTLIRNADLALYKAKDSGRGAFCFYSQEMHADAEARRQLEQDLRHAIGTGGLHLEYQPVVASATERISGFETLVRWTHPTRGAISPAVFIPVAEEAGLIAQLGDWVLRTACQHAVGWPEDVRVAVNVSPMQFANPSFPTLVMSAVAKSGLRPERLELEITESVFLDEGGNTDAMFAKLKAIGVRLALDDFGTGYSALGYLKTAPFDKIKIDQSFVRGAAIKGSRNGAIVQSIVSLAEALSMETTAEGAETFDELELIRSLGCSHIQGYIYGKPMTNDMVAARFAAGQTHAEPMGFKASRETRRTMLRSVKLHHGGNSYDARIRNISSGGAMVEGIADVPPGTKFRVAFSGSYAVEAECRWSSGGRTGLEFARPIAFDRAGRIEERLSPDRQSGGIGQRMAG